MIQNMKKIAMQAMNNSSPLTFYEATVLSAPPNISIRLRGNSNLALPKQVIIIADHLKAHKHSVTFPGHSGDTGSAGNHSHSVSGSTGEAEGHTHSLSGNTGSGGSHSHGFSVPPKTVETTVQDDSLKVGDHVMVAAVQGGQSFFIMDRIQGG